MTLEEILAVPTAASEEDLSRDVWDDANRLSYSHDGKRVLDAENFPSEISVNDGCEIICDGVFAFQDYMAGLKIGEKVPLEERTTPLDRIKLPATITHIGKEAFCECGDLVSIHLPSSLLYIGDYAFTDCWQLEKITIPARTRYIGKCAFQGCINLFQIKLGKEIEVIGEDAFDDCESLETVIIPHGMLDRYLTLLPKYLHRHIEEL
ncbi:MAG: leucine-rich repeat domain-containing protein [Bacteroidales bacterium]|nr:leucine-rich repeat domain-containing protein [Bacteroidales bacterium]